MGTWTTSPKEQQSFVTALEGKMNTLRQAISPATLYSSTAPTDAEVIAAWSAIKGTSYNPGVYEALQWVDPSTNMLRNHYQVINDLSSGAAASGKIYPIVGFPTGKVPYTKLDEIQIDEAGGAATQLFSNIDQGYNHLLVYVQWRSTVAALTSTLTIRPNANAAAIYSMQFQAPNSAQLAAGSGETVSTTGWAFTVPANTSERTLYHQGLLFIPDYARTDRPTRAFYRSSYASGAPLAAATTQAHFTSAFMNNLLAVTSLQFVGVTGTNAGTRLVLYGI
jgi:hypothetical protein